MLNKIICILFFAVSFNQLYAQSQYPGWNIYTSFREVKGVASAPNAVWAATSGGLFRFDQASLTGISKFTSLDGLLSNELTAISVSRDGNVWSGAFDGSISVYNPSNETWRQITDIRSSTEPSKRINSFYQYNNFMFFSTEFCIVKFDIPQFQFVDQPYTRFGNLAVPSAVYDVFVVNDTIWAATRNGIAYANINTSLPIQNNWRTFTANSSVMKTDRTNCITYFDSRVFFGLDSGMVYYQNGVLNTYEPLYNGNPIQDVVFRMAVSGGEMYFSTYKIYPGYTADFNIYRVNLANINSAELIQTGQDVNSLEFSSTGDLLIGTVNNGVDVYRNSTHNYVIPNGPYSNLNFNISVDNNSRVWAVSGSLGDWVPRSGIYEYDGTKWFNYTYSEFPIMGAGCCGWVMTYPDRSGNVWVAGFGNGLLKINGSDVEKFDETNSVLQPFGGPGFVLVQGIDEDNAGNLWVLNNRVGGNIINFTQQIAYPTPVGDPFAAHFTFLAIDNFNTKWMTLHPIEGSVRGVMYFNENTNPRGALIPFQFLGSDISQVNEVVTDNNGEVWIATNNGVVVIPNPEQVINSPGTIPTLFKMRIIENGISTPLTENVLSIDVDALNNKWLGTISNGVIYVSPDGSTLLSRFNTSNSPLLDNRITSIKSDRNTGTTYFGSEKGMVSYKTIAVNPLSECDVIKVGPNPFIVPGTAPLRIDGLVEESTVKILSISGVLVAEFETPGGRIANWDGKDLNGNYVASGIYIVAGFNKDGSKVCKGKVAIVRQ